MGLVQLQMKMVFLMAPITLFFFSETSVLGVVANVLIVPAVTWVMVPLGLFGVAIFVFHRSLTRCGRRAWHSGNCCVCRWIGF